MKTIYVLVVIFTILRRAGLYPYVLMNRLTVSYRMSRDSIVDPIDVFLDKHQAYYAYLSETEKRKFIKRTLYIRQTKEFIPVGEFNLTEEHEILIASVLAQLTFGLRGNFDLPLFNRIEVYPDVFYSGMVQQNVKGLTFSRGRILISWAHFYDGIADTTDKIHLGLHEFAHAMMLQFSNFKGNPYWKKWIVQADYAMDKTRLETSTLFRKYGTTNTHEFWAVSVETFFEDPFAFQNEFPDLYKTTSLILNQDMSARLKNAHVAA